ncbi:hypothetical protein P389DRAFT_192790 [Cystobasidium minutum MCA 4210]|uniref:uncharacterized protein n=1 Tax=Cystobasidium minutum MCA 4210 TaxID=1397322 RepID=UPI0034CD66E1|eukprot:jgi/Rhomi1/192790/gm1.1004_g
MSDKGKGKAKQAPAVAVAGSSSPNAAPSQTAAQQSTTANTSAAASTSTATAATASGPPMHTKGDWTAVWNADVGKYYYWNRKTNTTTWTNPFESGDAAANAASASSPVPSGSASPAGGPASTVTKDQSPQPVASPSDTVTGTAEAKEAVPGASGPSAADFGGIDPDLAYLDPSLASRAKGAGGAGAYAARFNARTGKFEADPTKNPDRVSDVQRAKRQNQLYFDYDGWQATLAQQQEQNALKRANGDIDSDEANKKHRPSKKEMEAIRMRNKEKKEKKQKGWLLN